MTCPHVNAFFSCSFRDEDKEVNDFFKSICEALNITGKNVSDGYSSIPPEVARKMIEDCKVVLAIIPKREQTNSGHWTMPSAVHEEMAMAFALKKPTLLVIEDGVSCDGFISNLGTFIKFDRTKIYTDDFIKKVVSSLHQLRMEAVETNNMIPEQDVAGFYAENVSFLIDLIRENGTPRWQYNSTRKLVFTRQFESQIKNSAWAECAPDDATEKILHSVAYTSNRTDLKSEIQIIKDTPQQLEVGMGFDTPLLKDDWVEIDFSYSSPLLNAITKSQIEDGKRAHIGGRIFDCFDGMIPIQPTRELHIQLRFPSWYPIDKGSIFPFVGSYSGGVDYVIDSELKRCQILQSKFGTNTQIDIRVESPLMRHVYGVAWNLN